MNDKRILPSRMERLIRSVLFLLFSLGFSLAAWAAGLYQLQDPVWIYAMIGGVVVAAALLGRFGARLIVRRMARAA